jgi:uncharacterized LabA/DUF88 family protein
MNKTSENIVYAFIDSQNLNLGIKSLGWELDFKKFFIYLKDKYHIQEAYLFLGYIKKYEKLYKYLEDCGYNIVFKPVVTTKVKKVKGNIDAELVLHSAKIEYKNYDKAIIVSGDGDFFCLLEDMVKEDRLYKLIIPNPKSESALLREFQEYKVLLNRDKRYLEKCGRRGVLPRK